MKILRLFSLSLVTMVMIPMGVNAHCEPDTPHSGDHRHCDAEPPGGGGGGGGNGKDAFYSAVISGAVSGDEGSELWHGNFGGKSRIGRNTGGAMADNSNNAGQLTLSFFIQSLDSGIGPFEGTRGAMCFADGLVHMGQTIVRSGKHGQAEGSFFFKANADNGTTPVGYLLTVIGKEDAFEGVWPPSGMTTMTLDTWKLTAGNEPGSIRDISCLGEGNFETELDNNLDDFVTIVVKREN